MRGLLYHSITEGKIPIDFKNEGWRYCFISPHTQYLHIFTDFVAEKGKNGDKKLEVVNFLK